MAELNSKLLFEIRQEYQIPPFFSDNSLSNLVTEGKNALGRLMPEVIDYDKDATARMLLKNYVYYAFNLRINDFFENYNSVILTWQLTSEVTVNEE